MAPGVFCETPRAHICLGVFHYQFLALRVFQHKVSLAGCVFETICYIFFATDIKPVVFEVPPDQQGHQRFGFAVAIRVLLIHDRQLSLVAAQPGEILPG